MIQSFLNCWNRLRMNLVSARKVFLQCLVILRSFRGFYMEGK
ncbi:unnamed protein product [Linum tenue]|uniref:Uncharacterized protein n=1 Tax=Linum tenue TaxID=586396 RepID=A0AAV0PNZ9_9ROSI|nr:unnamed protein product [Linum tenue]